MCCAGRIKPTAPSETDNACYPIEEVNPKGTYYCTGDPTDDGFFDTDGRTFYGRHQTLFNLYIQPLCPICQGWSIQVGLWRWGPSGRLILITNLYLGLWLGSALTQPPTSFVLWSVGHVARWTLPLPAIHCPDITSRSALQNRHHHQYHYYHLKYSVVIAW